MRSNVQALQINPRAAKSLERKGIARFRDIWDEREQAWHVETNQWNGLLHKEKETLSKAIEDIKEAWPTSQVTDVEPEFKHWEFKQESNETPPKPWLTKFAGAWQKEGCMLTEEACRKKLDALWKATNSGRLNLLLWRILSRKLPVRALTGKWGNSSHLCPRCHTKKETVKHALWDCLAIQPLWKKVSAMLERTGITEKIHWKQALLGNKGRMNPACFKLWQYIRALLLSKIWHDRNNIVHHKPALNLEASQVKGYITEACNLAKEKKRLKPLATIVMRKIDRL